jgi:hypothetical protein
MIAPTAIMPHIYLISGETGLHERVRPSLAAELQGRRKLNAEIAH